MMFISNVKNIFNRVSLPRVKIFIKGLIRCLKFFIYFIILSYILVYILAMNIVLHIKNEIFLPLNVLFILFSFFCFIRIRLLIIKINKRSKKNLITRFYTNSRNTFYMIFSDLIFFLSCLLFYAISKFRNEYLKFILIYNFYYVNNIGPINIKNIYIALLLVRLVFYFFSYYFNIKIIFIFIIDIIVFLFTIILLISLLNLLNNKMELFNYFNIVVKADFSIHFFYAYVDFSLANYLEQQNCDINPLALDYLGISKELKYKWYEEWFFYTREQNIILIDRITYDKNLDKFLYSRLEENYNKNYPEYVAQIRKYIFE